MLPKIDNYFEKLENETLTTEDFNTLQQNIQKNQVYDLLKCLFLPSDYLSNISINSPAYKSLLAARQAYDSLDFQLAGELLRKINSPEKEHQVFYREYKRLDDQINQTVNHERIVHLVNIKTRQLSTIELYQFLLELKTAGANLLSRYVHHLGMAVIHYALYIIHSDPRAENYSTLKSELLLIKARYLINESEDNYPVALQLFDQYLELKINTSNYNGYKYLVNRYQSYRSKESFSFLPIDSLLNLNIPVKEKLFLMTDLGFSLMDTLPDKAIQCFEKSLDFTNYISCSWQKNILYNYLSSAHLFKGNLEKAKAYLGLARHIESCTQADQTRSNYYNIASEINILQAEDPNKHREKIRQLHQKHRSMTDEIFFDSEAEHLEDYYTENAFDILNTIKKNQLDSNAYYIIRLLNETKLRKLKRARLADEGYRSISQNKKINGLLFHINDFKADLPYDDPSYAQLAPLLALNQPLGGYQSKSLIPQLNPSLDKIKSYSKEKQKAIISMLHYDGQYYIFSLSQDLFTLNKITHPELDSLILKYREGIQFSDSKNISEIKLILTPFIPQNSDLLILPDGPISFFPLHLLNPHQQVTTHYDIEEWIESSDQQLSAIKSFLYSFSDPSTISSVEERVFPELKYGYEEVNYIQALIPECRSFTGSEMNVHNFSTNFSGDLLHLSTHASSSSSNRLDNYFTLREEDGVNKFYGYEINGLNGYPKCVFLTSCESGYGQQKPGSGTYSLSRSFLEKGSQTVIKSLWKVNDYATKEFITYLYSQWLTGISLGEALHQARVHFRDTLKATTYEWAGFVMEGNPELYID